MNNALFQNSDCGSSDNKGLTDFFHERGDRQYAVIPIFIYPFHNTQGYPGKDTKITPVAYLKRPFTIYNVENYCVGI